MKRIAFVYIMSVLSSLAVSAQVIVPRLLSMGQVVSLAQENSIAAMGYRNRYESSFWNWKSYKAGLRPSLSLNAGLANFNRSLVALQDYNTGAISYRSNWNMSNDLTLQLSQNIPWTGGTLSFSASLSRLDQYSPMRETTYYNQPMFLSYSQSLWGYNGFKWSSQIAPKEYEAARRDYISGMENVSRTAVRYFWDCVYATENLEAAHRSYDESCRLYDAAVSRYGMGLLSYDQLQQIEINVLRDSLDVSSSATSLQTALNCLCSYIGYQDNTRLKLVTDYDIPDLNLDYSDVLSRGMENSSFCISQDIEYLRSMETVEQAESGTWPSAYLNARFGVSGTGRGIKESASGLQNQEVVGLTLGIPLLDWGVGKGRRRMAEAQAQTIRLSIEQNMADFRQELMAKVIRFNNQRSQCLISERASSLAQDSYALALKNFGSGSMSVLQLEQLKDMSDNARSQYISSVAAFWDCYFEIRALTLYDYMSGTDIVVEFDKLVR